MYNKQVLALENVGILIFAVVFAVAVIKFREGLLAFLIAPDGIEFCRDRRNYVAYLINAHAELAQNVLSVPLLAKF